MDARTTPKINYEIHFEKFGWMDRLLKTLSLSLSLSLSPPIMAKNALWHTMNAMTQKAKKKEKEKKDKEKKEKEEKKKQWRKAIRESNAMASRHARAMARQ